MAQSNASPLINEAFLTEAAITAGLHRFGELLQGQHITLAEKVVNACAEIATQGGGRDKMVQFVAARMERAVAERSRFAALVLDRCATIAISEGRVRADGGALILAAYDVSTWPTYPDPIARVAGRCGWSELDDQDRVRLEAVARHCAGIADWHDRDPTMRAGYAILAHFGLAEARPHPMELADDIGLPNLTSGMSAGQAAYLGHQHALQRPADWQGLCVTEQAAWECAAMAVSQPWNTEDDEDELDETPGQQNG